MKLILFLTLLVVPIFNIHAWDNSELSSYENSQLYWYWYDSKVKDVYLMIEDKMDMYLAENFLPMTSENIIKLDSFSITLDEYAPTEKQLYIYQSLQVKMDAFMYENKIGYMWWDLIYKDKEGNLLSVDSETWISRTTDFRELTCTSLYSYWEMQDGTIESNKIIELIWTTNYNNIIPSYDFKMRNSSLCTDKEDTIFIFYATVGPLEGSWWIWITGSFMKSYDSNWIFLQKYKTSRLSYKWFTKYPVYIGNSDIIYAERSNSYSSQSLIKE